ncbi:hypothetical protein K7X08_036095 [Anisodus acutangulus]|uniref:Uncharacterized protein n=1 Tax=Anisodus acutangulus TaxID=402998 RepID=A0A9Q1L7V4_9SOLA|nr:hypothetical protein K7X08_036095 [Anisodus acutangulus]
MSAKTIAKNVTTRLLLNFPFDPGSDDGHAGDVTKVFDENPYRVKAKFLDQVANMESCLVPFDGHVYVKSSCLDNEKGAFTDIIGRNSLVVFSNNSTQVRVVHFDVVKNWQLLAKSHISHSVRIEYHVEIFSFVDKDQLEPRSIWMHNKIISVTHIIFLIIKFGFGIGKFLFDRLFNDIGGAGYYQESSHVYDELYVVEVFRKVMTTRARRTAATVDLMKTQDFFREYSVFHFGGEELHQPRYLEILMLPSVSTRRQFPTLNSDSFLLIECFPFSSQVLRIGFAQFAPPVFQRCLKIIQSHVLSIDDLDSGSLQYDREIINCSFNLFSGSTADLDHSIVCLVSQSNLRNLLLHCFLDVVPAVGQRALAFLQHLAMGCPVRLRLYWAAILDTMTTLLNTFKLKKPNSVANNAFWIIEKFAIKVLKEMTSIVLTVLACLVQPLHHALVENSYVTLRNLAGNGLELVFYNIEQFMQVWSPTLSMILEDTKKEDVFAIEFVLKVEEACSTFREHSCFLVRVALLEP